MLASAKYGEIITGKDFGTVFKNIPQFYAITKLTFVIHMYVIHEIYFIKIKVEHKLW